MMLHEAKTEKAQKDPSENEDSINSEIEELLTNNINECLKNDKFIELPISTVYRIIEQSSKLKTESDALFDFIKKSLKNFCILFRFLDISKLSEDRFSELYELYLKSKEENLPYFSYMNIELAMVNDMKERMKKLENGLDQVDQEKRKLENENRKIEEIKEELEAKNSELKQQIDELEEKRKEEGSRNSDLQDLITQLEKRLKQSEEEKKELQKQLETRTKSEVVAQVKNGLFVSGKIRLNMNGAKLDTKRSKYIVSTSGEEKVGCEAYLNGYPIKSEETDTNEILCKSGRYWIRCLVFDDEGKSIEIVSNPVTTSGNCASFPYEGKPTIFSLSSGKYKLEVWGSKGGDSIGTRCNSRQPGHGGLGGYSSGIIRLQKDERVQVLVGGEGRPSNSSEGSTTSGGFPDGGGTKTGHFKSFTSVPGTGGGSTSIGIDIGTGISRVIVAGGGGGASGSCERSDHGGFGGGLSGGNCYWCNSQQSQGAGTQTGSTGGLGSSSTGDPGKFGLGATGKYKAGCDSGGGGGGGWYGGGSGGHGSFTASGSGGGGSGWTFTESNFNAWRSGDQSNASNFHLDSSFYLTDTACKSGEEEFPRPDGNGTEIGHSGNGFAKITPI